VGVRTLGVDLAAEPTKSALAVLRWRAGRADVERITLGATDSDIVAAAAGCDRVGIDAPFGWPDAFVRFVVAHHALGDPDTSIPPSERDLPASSDTREARALLVRRVTDETVRARTGLIPLSVSADLIAHVAMRCVGLLRALEVTDRVDGPVVEAYPAAALRVWGLDHRGYKGPTKSAVLDRLVDELQARAPWLQLGVSEAAIRGSDDVFDAVVAACIARAAALGQTHLPDPETAAIARREGWIHLPSRNLEVLAG
jgi:predicted nuclease with RNAse H fold